MIRLLNDNLARALHQPLYQRLLQFAQQYTPEVPAEPVVQAWLSRLYMGDDTLHILIDIDEKYNIDGHAILDVQQVHGSCVVVAHQVQMDKKDIAKLDEVVEYGRKLREHVGAHQLIFFMQRDPRAVVKRYGFAVSRSVMIDPLVVQETENGERHG